MATEPFLLNPRKVRRKKRKTRRKKRKNPSGKIPTGGRGPASGRNPSGKIPTGARNPRRKRRKRRRKTRKNLSLAVLNPKRKKRRVRRKRRVRARKVRRKVRRKRVRVRRKVRRRTRKRKSSVIPKRKTRRRKRRVKTMARKRRRGRRRSRRNPAFKLPKGFRGLRGQLGDAAALATGLIGVSLVGNILPLPIQFKTGFVRHLTKAALALGMGFVASKLVKGPTAKMVALGGLASVVVDVVNDVTAQTGLMLPGPSEGMSHYTGMGMGAFPAYSEPGMGHYTGVEGLGHYGGYLS